MTLTLYAAVFCIGLGCRLHTRRSSANKKSPVRSFSLAMVLWRQQRQRLFDFVENTLHAMTSWSDMFRKKNICSGTSLALNHLDLSTTGHGHHWVLTARVAIMESLLRCVFCSPLQNMLSTKRGLAVGGVSGIDQEQEYDRLCIDCRRYLFPNVCLLVKFCSLTEKDNIALLDVRLQGNCRCGYSWHRDTYVLLCEIFITSVVMNRSLFTRRKTEMKYGKTLWFFPFPD